MASALAIRIANRIMKNILNDLSGRGGFDHMIDGLREDPETFKELQETWRFQILDEIEPYLIG